MFQKIIFTIVALRSDLLAKCGSSVSNFVSSRRNPSSSFLMRSSLTPEPPSPPPPVVGRISESDTSLPSCMLVTLPIGVKVV